MDAVQKLVEGGCGVETNPFMTAVDEMVGRASLRLVAGGGSRVDSTSGSMAATQSHDPRRMEFTRSASAGAGVGVAAPLPSPYAPALQRAWSQSAAPATAHAQVAAPRWYGHAQAPHMMMPFPYQQIGQSQAHIPPRLHLQSFEPAPAALHSSLRSKLAPPSAMQSARQQAPVPPPGGGVGMSATDASEVLEAEYARTLLSGAEFPISHGRSQAQPPHNGGASASAAEAASSVVQSLRRAAQSDARIGESEFLRDMEGVSSGAIEITESELRPSVSASGAKTPTAASGESRPQDMPTNDEIQRRVQVLEHLWKTALLGGEESEAMGMGLGEEDIGGRASGGGAGLSEGDLEDIWAEATAAAQARHNNNNTQPPVPRTFDEYWAASQAELHARVDDSPWTRVAQEAELREVLERTWADVNEQSIGEALEGPPLSSEGAAQPAVPLGAPLGDPDTNIFFQTWQSGTGDPSAASASTSTAIHVDRPSPAQAADSFFEMGLQYFDAGNIRDAQAAFEAALHATSSHSEAWRMLGQCYAEQDNDKLAISCLERAVDEDPYNLKALQALGVSYVNERDREKAFATLQSWVHHHPRFHSLQVPTDIYSDGSLLDSVTQLMLAADAHSRGDVEVATVLGVLHNASEDYEAALEAFQRAVAAAPRDYSLWNKLGATLANVGKHTAALKAYEESTRIKPQFARGWLNAGLSHYHMGNYSAAAQSYLRSLRVAPTAAHIWALLRISFSRMNRYDLVAKTEACNPAIFEAEFGV